MKSKDKKYKIFMAVFVLSLIFFLYNQKIFSEMKRNQELINEFTQYTSGEIKLLDSYDSDTSSFSDFIDTPDALKIETSAYNLLINSDDLNYYEVYFNPFYYTNYYNKKDQAEHGFINECIDGEYYTECKGIYIDDNFEKDYGLDKAIEEGRFFLESEYNCDITKKIPIVLGSSYSSAFKINESFSGEYIIGQPLSFVVVGFLKENTSITLTGMKYNLNDYFIIPTLSINSIENVRDKVILLSTKIEGFVHYDSAEDYQQAADEINLIAENSKFDYIHVVSARDYEDKFDISFEQCKLRYKTSFLAFACCSVLGLFMLFWKRRKNGSFE
ncbi:MAG: ABC transporter permease [Lachnospiraceae bacterium]|nr:ABC transporter permease [Lachnospiraceae bacterium]